MSRYRCLITSISLLLTLFILSGCFFASNSGEQAIVKSTPSSVPDPDKLTISEFILGPDDVIEIGVYRTPHSEFVLWTGDKIEISLYRQADYKYTLQLGADGMLTLPLVGDVHAAGLTKLALRDKIIEELSKYFVEPQILINVQSGRELYTKDLTGSYTIDSSGKIIYPILGDLQAAGKSVFALRDEIEAKLAENFLEPKVSINLSTINSQKYMVLGEVSKPGVYSLTAQTSVLRAIAHASGPTTDAKLDNVVLVRNTGEKSEVISLDLSGVSGAQNPNAIYIQKDDIVYVAERRIASISRFMSHIALIMKPFVSLESGIVLWPQVIDTLEGDKSGSDVNVIN